MSDMYFTPAELMALGFKSVGKRVRISRKSSFYANRGSIGDDVRIDDFCILKGHIEIGCHVHICAFCSISGVCGKVTLSDFSTLSNRVSVFTGSDDYRADALSSSTVPEAYLATIKGDVFLGRAALIGAHAVILPGSVIGDASAVGALCIVYGRIQPGDVVSAGRAKLLVKRTRDAAKILRMADEVLTKDRSRKDTGNE